MKLAEMMNADRSIAGRIVREAVVRTYKTIRCPEFRPDLEQWQKRDCGKDKGRNRNAHFEPHRRYNYYRKRGIILAGGHVRASAGALAVHTALILAGGHVRASAGALAVHTALILAGGHVRASAGALAVHTALILAGGHVREAPWT